MELKRKINNWLNNWKNIPDHKPALIKGIRQSGKTYSVRHFAAQHYKNVIYLNFMSNPSLTEIFSGSLTINELLPLISAHFPNTIFEPKTTVFIFDEIQECPRARLSLKEFFLDKRFDIISTGSFLGIKGYISDDSTPLPVGYEDSYTMKTLDFEEFLWANGYTEQHINVLRKCFAEKKPLAKSLFDVYSGLFKQYLCIGGFPEVVDVFLSTHNISLAQRTLHNISEDLQNDFGRRKGKAGKNSFQLNEVARIRNAYDLIPFFLGKENKRYIVSKIGGIGNQSSKNDALEYLCDAGIISKSFNLSIPSIPLKTNEIYKQFKIYPNDIGLLVSSLEEGTTQAILSGQLGQAKGLLYESLVADSLLKNDVPLFYFSKTSGLEIDFVINYEGVSTLLEVKAENGTAKSAKTVLQNKENYGQTRLICIKNKNIGFENGVFTIPHFLTFLLNNNKDIIAEDYTIKKAKL